MYTKVDGKDDYTVARVDARTQAEAGDVVKFAIDANHVHLFDPETELAILGVPHINYIPANLSAKDDALIVKFGKNEINLGEGSIKILTEPSLLGGEILIGIKPESAYIAAEKTDDYVMECEVDFVEDADVYKNVFLKVDGKRGLFAIKAPSDVITSGKDKVKLAIRQMKLYCLTPPREQEYQARWAFPNTMFWKANSMSLPKRMRRIPCPWKAKRLPIPNMSR